MASSSSETPDSPLIIKNLATLAGKTPQAPDATEDLEKIQPENPLPSAFDSGSSTADLYGFTTGKGASSTAEGGAAESAEAGAAAKRPDLAIRADVAKTADNPPTSANWRPTFFREQSWSKEDHKRQMHADLMRGPGTKEGERGWSAKE